MHGLLKMGNNAPPVVTVLADLVRINPKLAGVWCALFGDGILWRWSRKPTDLGSKTVSLAVNGIKQRASLALGA